MLASGGTRLRLHGRRLTAIRSFVVYTSTGGGGNSSGTNCAVYAWSDFYSYMVGDNFYGEIGTYCSLTNETLWAGWDIVNVDSNSTVDTGSLSWTTTQWHETQYLNTTSLVNVSAGTTRSMLS